LAADGRRNPAEFTRRPAAAGFGPDARAEYPAIACWSAGARARPPATPLSPREVEILRLIAAGRSNQEIATGLVLSVRTVERHISNLYVKIGARRKADATAYALRNGFA
jgi:DNA-binding NarL/FixJ family response regulator